MKPWSHSRNKKCAFLLRNEKKNHFAWDSKKSIKLHLFSIYAAFKFKLIKCILSLRVCCMFVCFFRIKIYCWIVWIKRKKFLCSKNTILVNLTFFYDFRFTICIHVRKFHSHTFSITLRWICWEVSTRAILLHFNSNCQTKQGKEQEQWSEKNRK